MPGCVRVFCKSRRNICTFQSSQLALLSKPKHNWKKHTCYVFNSIIASDFWYRTVYKGTVNSWCEIQEVQVPFLFKNEGKLSLIFFVSEIFAFLFDSYDNRMLLLEWNKPSFIHKEKKRSINLHTPQSVSLFAKLILCVFFSYALLRICNLFFFQIWSWLHKSKHD